MSIIKLVNLIILLLILLLSSSLKSIFSDNKYKFIYFYSPLYEFYNQQISEKCKNNFKLKPILIDDVVIKDKNGHHFNGHNIKIELIIKEIKDNMNNNIIFSDATIFISDKNKDILPNYLSNYINYDIVFINEYPNVYNIGFMFIKCSEKMLYFFEKVLELLINKTFTHDQACINDLIKKDDNILYTCFSKEIYCGFEFKNNERDTYIIYKSFIQNTGNLIENYNQRIENFKNNKLIDDNTYNLWYKK